MEPKGSLPHSQEPATCPYPQPAREEENITTNFAAFVMNIDKNMSLRAIRPGEFVNHISISRISSHRTAQWYSFCSNLVALGPLVCRYP